MKYPQYSNTWIIFQYSETWITF